MDRSSTAVVSMALMLVLAMALPLGALAKGKPATEATNNLSVPTIMVAGGGFTGVTCGTAEIPSVLVPPTGTPLSGFPDDPAAYYYVQGVHKWQAQCYATATMGSVTAEWGDNLSGDAKLKVGSPIRVELGLFNATGAAMDGYTVEKLDETALDRAAPYGTVAASGELDAPATVTSFTKVRVFDGTATFSIQNVATGTYVVQPGTKASAEINSTGNVVYGYNLRVSAVGEYVITYSTPSVTIIGTDAGDFTDNSVSLGITVIAGGGGGGGKPR